jgi:hypothetical protein
MKQSASAKPSLTTIAVSPAVQQKAKAHAEALGVSLREFSEGALQYFVKYKLNPAEVNAVEDVPKEVYKLRNQVFSFLKKQEFEHLLPLLRQAYSLHGQGQQVQQQMESLHRQLEEVYLLLFKIKTIQDISLTTLYRLSEQDEETLSEVMKHNKQRFLSEMKQFTERLEGKTGVSDEESRAGG